MLSHATRQERGRERDRESEREGGREEKREKERERILKLLHIMLQNHPYCCMLRIGQQIWQNF